MQQILFMSADRRLAIFLTDELAKTGGADLRMTHDQMAKYMGSAREVVSRMLKYFAQEGWVRLYRGGVQVLDKQKLQALARGEWLLSSFCRDDFECAPRCSAHKLSENIFNFRNTGASADAPVFHFHGWGRKDKQHL